MKVAQSCPTPGNPRDYTVHEILQAKTLEWVVVPFSRVSSQPRDGTQVERAVLKLKWELHATHCLMSRSHYSQNHRNAPQRSDKTKNAGAQRGKGLEQSPSGEESQGARASRCQPGHLPPPAGPGSLTHLVPRRGAGLPALTWRCRRPPPVIRLSSPLLVAPGVAFPIAQVTPEPGLLASAGAGRAGEAATR